MKAGWVSDYRPDIILETVRGLEVVSPHRLKHFV